MGKSTLTLAGAYDAWSPRVRRGSLLRPTGASAPVLVRVSTDERATPEALAALRQDARLLARVQHESVLRLEHVGAVGGHVAYVYEMCDAASLARVRHVEAAAGRPFPVRAAVEIVAAVALALDEALRVSDVDGRQVHHAGPGLEDVLLEASGRVRVAGFVVTRGAAGEAFRSSAGAAATHAAARLLACLLCPEEAASGAAPAALARCLRDDRRPHAGPPDHGAAGRSEPVPAWQPAGRAVDHVLATVTPALGADPALREAPGALGRTLREEAVHLPGEGVRTWAPRALSAARDTAALDPRAAGGAAAPVGVLAPPHAPPLRADDRGRAGPLAYAASADGSRVGAPRSSPAVLPVRRVPRGTRNTEAGRHVPGEPTVPTDPPEDRPTRVSGGARQTIAPPTGRPTQASPPTGAPAQRGLSARTGPSLDLLVSGEDDEEEATVIGIARPIDLAPPPPKADLFAVDELGVRPAASASPAPVARATSVFDDDDVRPAQTSIRSTPRGSGSMGTVIAVVIGLLVLGAAALAYVLLRSDDVPQAPEATSP